MIVAVALLVTLSYGRGWHIQRFPTRAKGHSQVASSLNMVTTIKYEYSGVFTKDPKDNKGDVPKEREVSKPDMILEESDAIKLMYQKVHTFGGLGTDKRKTDNKELKFLLGGKGISSSKLVCATFFSILFLSFY